MTPADPELSRLRRAFVSLSDENLSASCPTAEDLWSGARGELPGPQVEGLVEHIGGCGACAELWRMAAAVDAGAPARVLEMPRQPVAWRAPLAVAASIAVVVIGFYGVRTMMLQDPAAPETLATAAPKPAAIPDVLKMDKPPVKISSRHALLFRGETNSNDSFLTDSAEAFDFYKADRFEDSVKAFDTLGRKYPQAAEPSFYKGVSLLMLGRWPAAVEPLKDARPLADEELARDAEWYLAIAYHRSGQLDQARTTLRPICAATGAYAARACAALRELTPAPQ